MLVFDVGMHNGDDTAHYLSLGHRVVAVEANPRLCEEARRRFGREIGGGRLVVEDVAIAPSTGELPFYVTKGETRFSSLDRDAARRDGLEVEEITVRSVPFGDLLERHGVPFYLKVDIERADALCLDALRDRDELPAFISVEANALEDLCRLWCLGYRRFKVIDQTTHNAPRSVPNEAIAGPLRQLAGHYLGRLRERLRPGRFPPGSSGPFGDDTPGEWQDLEAVANQWLHFEMGHRWRGSLNPRGWFDFHAAL